MYQTETEEREMPEHYMPRFAEVRDMVHTAVEPQTGDVWGSSTAAAFAIAEALYRSGFDVPAEYGYRPAPSIRIGEAPDREGDFWTAEFYDLLQATCAADEALVYFLRVLGKHRALCVAAGRDY